MTFIKMIIVSLKNIKTNLKAAVIYGMLIPLSIIVLLPMPKIFSSVLSCVFMVLIPIFSNLPLIIALTNPSPEGPYTFKERFNLKKLPFGILSLITGLITIIFSVLICLIFSLLSIVSGLFFVHWQLTLLLFSLLIIVFSAISITLDSVKHFIFITHATENIKISEAILKGIKLFFKHPFKNIIQYLLFSVLISVLPAVIFVFLIPNMLTSILGIYFITLLAAVFSSIMNPFIISFTIELYRKNILTKE